MALKKRQVVMVEVEVDAETFAEAEDVIREQFFNPEGPLVSDEYEFTNFIYIREKIV